MKISLILIFAFCFGVTFPDNVLAQVGIGTTTPDTNSSALDISAANKGILIPRIDYNNKPANPAAGLLIYVISNGPFGNNSFYYFDGTGWNIFNTSATNLSHYIGENYGGGKVFYVYDNGKHGLIAAPSYWGYAATWGKDGETLIKADGLGAGAKNTAALVSASINLPVIDRYYVATECFNLYAGFEQHTDWYLPSKYELGLLRNTYTLLNTTYSYPSFWSSTEHSADKVWTQNFTTGVFELADKDAYPVFAYRSFVPIRAF